MQAAVVLACAISAAPAAWVSSLWDAWDSLSSTLPTANARNTTVVTFDDRCQWTFDGRTPVRGQAHEGRVVLPDGGDMPPVVTSFASTYGDEKRPFLVVSAPPIWRAQPVERTEAELTRLLKAVFVHEMTHALQTPLLAPAFDRVVPRLAEPDALTDDIIQDTFGDDSAFREMVERERDLLFEAARSADPAYRRQLMRAVAQSMDERRDRFFAGEKAFYGELEDLFLIMEGAGQWAAYQVVRQDGADAETAIAVTRGRARRWSQDVGLALFLALDASGDGWREQVFGSNASAATVPALLRQ